MRRLILVFALVFASAAVANVQTVSSTLANGKEVHPVYGCGFSFGFCQPPPPVQ